MDNPNSTIPASFNDNLVAQLSVLKKFARKFTTELEEIDDLVQDTLVKALMAADKYQNGTNLKAWLYVLMKNIYINSYRKQKQQRKFMETEDIALCHFSTTSTYKNGGEEKFVNTDIVQALKKLKPTLNHSFESFLQGYKYIEISKTHQIPLGTVKTRIFEARAALKIILAPYQFKD